MLWCLKRHLKIGSRYNPKSRIIIPGIVENKWYLKLASAIPIFGGLYSCTAIFIDALISAVSNSCPQYVTIQMSLFLFECEFASKMLIRYIYVYIYIFTYSLHHRICSKPERLATCLTTTPSNHPFSWTIRFSHLSISPLIHHPQKRTPEKIRWNHPWTPWLKGFQRLSSCIFQSFFPSFSHLS